MTKPSTRRLSVSADAGGEDSLLTRFRAAIVLLSGDLAGSEYELATARTVIGRGPAVDLAFDDSSMSRQHAAIELGPKGFKIQDLGSTNGILVNDTETQVAELKHGDRFCLGEQKFQFLLEKRKRGPRAYTLPDV